MLTKLKSLVSSLNCDIGIDLGTANTVVYMNQKGIVLREPSVVAIDKKTEHVLAIGAEAQKMVGRTPGSIIAVRPMKDGVIADYATTEAMIQTFIKKILSKPRLSQPRILIGIPYGITNVERRAILDAARSSSRNKVYLVDEPMAAAVGANIDVENPQGEMIVDIGGGTTEVAVISMGSIVVSESIRVAGDEFDEAIISFCRKTHQLLIGSQMSEKIKINIGSATPFDKERSMSITGRDLMTGLPRKVTIESDDIRGALREPITRILHALRRTLERTPPELSSDIVHNGLLLTGGGSLLHGLDTLFQEEVHISVRMAEDPLSCVALGTGKILSQMSVWSKRL